MPKYPVPAITLIVVSFFLLAFAQPSPLLSTEDEIRAGDALLAAFQKSQGFAETQETN